MKPIGYYADSNTQIDGLTEQFGPYLENLNRDSKLELQLCLAIYVCCLEYGTCTTFYGVVEECPLEEISDDTHKAMEILEDISQRSAQQLLVAIGEQLAYNHGR